MNRCGVERFPSLVEAAAAQRMDNWREWAAKREWHQVRLEAGRKGGEKRRASRRTVRHPRQLSPAMDAAIWEAHNKGESTLSISRRYRVSWRAVRRAVARMDEAQEGV